jgi:hypothetical protein
MLREPFMYISSRRRVKSLAEERKRFKRGMDATVLVTRRLGLRSLK